MSQSNGDKYKRYCTRNPFQYLQNTTEITTAQKPLYCKETKILPDAASVLSALDRMM
jgi:hypothetical protein